MPISTIFYISLAFLLLYDCSAYSYNSYNFYNSYNSYNSNNIYYSDYFKSGSKHFNSNFFNSGFVSNKFNSNFFNSVSYNFASNPFEYISFVKSNFVSSNLHIYSILSSSFNHKLIVSSKSNSNNCVSQTYLTLMNSFSFVQSRQRSYPLSIAYIPTILPTSIINTLAPSLAPSLAPLVLEFITDLTLSNVQTNYLDTLAQQSVVIATANSMNISIDFVSFVSSSISNSVKIGNIRLLSFNLIATTKTSIPLINKYSVFTSDPTTLFTALSNTMTIAVANGAFTNYLVAASLQLNSTATASASISGITNVQINGTLISPTTASPTSSPTTSSPTTASPTTASPTSSPTILNKHGVTSPYFQTNYYYILLYVFGSFLSFWLLVYIAIVYRRSYIRKQIELKRNRLHIPQLVTLSTAQQNNSNNDIKNTQDIELIIVNNQ